MNCTAYKGKHKRLFSVSTDKQGTKITVYLADNTLVVKVDKDGNVKTDLEPI